GLLFLLRLLLELRRRRVLGQALAGLLHALAHGLLLVGVDAGVGRIVQTALEREHAVAVDVLHDVIDPLAAAHARLVGQRRGGAPALLRGAEAGVRAEPLQAFQRLPVHAVVGVVRIGDQRGLVAARAGLAQSVQGARAGD